MSKGGDRNSLGQWTNCPVRTRSLLATFWSKLQNVQSKISRHWKMKLGEVKHPDQGFKVGGTRYSCCSSQYQRRQTTNFCLLKPSYSRERMLFSTFAFWVMIVCYHWFWEMIIGLAENAVPSLRAILNSTKHDETACLCSGDSPAEFLCGTLRSIQTIRVWPDSSRA